MNGEFPAPPGASAPGERAIVLLHGWPQTSHAWRRVLPLLGTDRTCVAPDLRGVGRSCPARTGFDKATMAGDVHATVTRLRLDRPVLVGHDIGALVGYALARRYSGDLSGLVIVDSPLPGIAGWDETVASPAYWHLDFHRDVDCRPPIADTLVDGRQAAYFRSFIDRFAAHPGAITDNDIAIYAEGYHGARLAAGFGMFRALTVDIADNQAATGELAVPILLAFGEFSNGSVLDVVAGGLRDAGATDVCTTLLHDCGHWPAEENPGELAEVIREFARSVTGFAPPRG
jgi:pimeloyl-ACP methyl ester carboxylesterase